MQISCSTTKLWYFLKLSFDLKWGQWGFLEILECLNNWISSSCDLSGHVSLREAKVIKW